MGDWKTAYRSKRTTARLAVETIQQGETLYLGGNAATPRTLATALASRGESIRGVRVAHVLLLGEDPFAEAAEPGRQSWENGTDESVEQLEA